MDIIQFLKDKGVSGESIARLKRTLKNAPAKPVSQGQVRKYLAEGHAEAKPAKENQKPAGKKARSLKKRKKDPAGERIKQKMRMNGIRRSARKKKVQRERLKRTQSQPALSKGNQRKDRMDRKREKRNKRTLVSPKKRKHKRIKKDPKKEILKRERKAAKLMTMEHSMRGDTQPFERAHREHTHEVQDYQQGRRATPPDGAPRRLPAMNGYDAHAQPRHAVESNVQVRGNQAQAVNNVRTGMEASQLGSASPQRMATGSTNPDAFSAVQTKSFLGPQKPKLAQQPRTRKAYCMRDPPEEDEIMGCVDKTMIFQEDTSNYLTTTDTFNGLGPISILPKLLADASYNRLTDQPKFPISMTFGNRGSFDPGRLLAVYAPSCKDMRDFRSLATPAIKGLPRPRLYKASLVDTTYLPQEAESGVVIEDNRVPPLPTPAITMLIRNYIPGLNDKGAFSNLERTQCGLTDKRKGVTLGIDYRQRLSLAPPVHEEPWEGGAWEQEKFPNANLTYDNPEDGLETGMITEPDHRADRTALQPAGQDYRTKHGLAPELTTATAPPQKGGHLAPLIHEDGAATHPTAAFDVANEVMASMFSAAGQAEEGDPDDPSRPKLTSDLRSNSKNLGARELIAEMATQIANKLAERMDMPRSYSAPVTPTGDNARPGTADRPNHRRAVTMPSIAEQPNNPVPGPTVNTSAPQQQHAPQLNTWPPAQRQTMAPSPMGYTPTYTGHRIVQGARRNNTTIGSALLSAKMATLKQQPTGTPPVTASVDPYNASMSGSQLNATSQFGPRAATMARPPMRQHMTPNGPVQAHGPMQPWNEHNSMMQHQVGQPQHPMMSPMMMNPMMMSPMNSMINPMMMQMLMGQQQMLGHGQSPVNSIPLMPQPHVAAQQAQSIQRKDAPNRRGSQLNPLKATTPSERSGRTGRESNAAASEDGASRAQIKDLFSKAVNNRHKQVEELFAMGVPPDTIDEHGNTVLHVAAQNGNKKLIKATLRWGANINAQNTQGQTPLHYLFAYKYEELAAYLISKGADDSIQNEHGYTCYDGLRPEE